MLPIPWRLAAKSLMGSERRVRRSEATEARFSMSSRWERRLRASVEDDDNGLGDSMGIVEEQMRR